MTKVLLAVLSCRRPSRWPQELPCNLSVQSSVLLMKSAPSASAPSACSELSTAQAMAQHLKEVAFLATCSLVLEQHKTRELPMMPHAQMARLKLRIERTSMATAQHLTSLIALLN